MSATSRWAGALAAALLALCLIPAAAQKEQKKVPGGKNVVSPALLKKLDLTPEQQQKLQAANQTLEQELQKVAPTGDKNERRQAGRAAYEAYEAAVLGMLTAEQKTRLEALRAEEKELLSLGPVGSQLVGLDLTDDQKSKIRAIVDRHQPELQKAKESGDKQTAKQTITEVNRKMRDEVLSILTPEQQKALGPGKKSGAKGKPGAPGEKKKPGKQGLRKDGLPKKPAF